MKEFIHSLTGTRMWVADDREQEYLAAGHRLAGSEEPKDQDPPADEVAEVQEGEKAPDAAKEPEEKSSAAPKAAPTLRPKRPQQPRKNEVLP